jgi:N-acetylglucosaminyl-diphospho-decaprenol L-rhamnosyltransferase
MTRSSVVVVSYQPGRWLERCLRSVLAQADEVVVVDNGSVDQRATHVAKAVGARAVTLDRNTGFAAGVNTGVRASRGDVVALLNDDAFAAPDWLSRSIEVLENPAVAAVSPKLLFDPSYIEIRLDETPHFDPPDPRPLGRHVVELTVGGVDALEGTLGPGIHRLETGPPGPPRWRWTTGSGPIYVPLPADVDSKDVLCNGEPIERGDVVDLVNNAGSYLSREGYGGDYGYATPDRGHFDRGGDRFAACGAAMVMRADVLKRLGPFEERFFAYYEDTDWCWRAQLAGMSVLYEPRAVVRHMHGATSGGPTRPWVRRLSARNRLATLVRNAPRPVVARQLQRARTSEGWPELRVPVARMLPWALWQRRTLAQRRTVEPHDVWRRWAGVNEEWPADGVAMES